MKKILKRIGIVIGVFVLVLTVYQIYEWNQLLKKENKFLNKSYETNNDISDVIKPGDVLIRVESVNYEMDLVNDIITFYGGGHAGVYSGNGKSLESYGSSSPDNIANFYDVSKWNDLVGTIIVLRPNTKVDENKIQNIIGKYNKIPYDFLFNSFNKNLYCSELIVSIYHEYGYNIDDDGLILQTPIDIVLANELDIIYMRKDGINYEIKK